jgi:hypothetical protein
VSRVQRRRKQKFAYVLPGWYICRLQGLVSCGSRRKRPLLRAFNFPKTNFLHIYPNPFHRRPSQWAVLVKDVREVEADCPEEDFGKNIHAARL